MEQFWQQVDDVVAVALAEDTSHGDPTSEVLIPPELMGRAAIMAKERGMLAGGEVETVSEIYQRFRSADPELMLFSEAAMNIAGYRFFQQGMVDEAIVLFKMNAEVYPQSANCWDSLAEAYMANDDNENALACVEKVLETLPNDTAIDDNLRQALEANAERYMETLKEEEAEEEADSE